MKKPTQIKNKRPRNKNGKPHGKWYFYYDNGQVRLIRNFFDGELNGVDTLYSKNGNIVSEVTFKMGQRHGYFNYRDRDGKTTSSGYYKLDGKINFWVNSKNKQYYLCLI